MSMSSPLIFVEKPNTQKCELINGQWKCSFFSLKKTFIFSSIPCHLHIKKRNYVNKTSYMPICHRYRSAINGNNSMHVNNGISWIEFTHSNNIIMWSWIRLIPKRSQRIFCVKHCNCACFVSTTPVFNVI